MATQKAVVIKNGEVEQLQAGDNLDLSLGTAFPYATGGTGVLAVVNGGTGSSIALVGNVVMTGGNVTTTSTGASDVTGMVVPVSASSRYIITFWLRVGCNNTGGLKLAVTSPSGSTYSFTYWGDTTGATVFGRTAPVNVDDSLGSVALSAVNSVGGFCLAKCDITTGVTAGNLQLRFASVTSTQISTIFQILSHVDWRKVA